MTTTILPGLTVTDEMYQAAHAGITVYASDTHLTWEKFTTAAAWTLIPDDRGELSKAEITLIRSIERTVRLNIWFRPDLRGGDRPMPHNHPWRAFTGHVLLGGYSENRYRRDESGDVLADLGVTHRAPAANTVHHDTYHEVTEIHEPGHTLSLMVCGRGQRGDWGYLDTDTGEHRMLQPVADFAAMLAALNPHQRPAY